MNSLFAFASGNTGLAPVLAGLIAFLLGAKVVATIALLRRDREARYRGPTAALLWWVTKIAPLLAAPSAVLWALARGSVGDAWAYGALTLFVYVAVPVMVWRRHTGRLA